MRKLVVVLGALVVVLLSIAPVPAKDGAPELPRTEVEGNLPATGFLGAAGDEIEATWVPIVGQACSVRNEEVFPVQVASGTVIAPTDPAPSRQVTCHITASNLTGVAVGNDLCVLINFSFTATAPGDIPTACGTAALAPKKFRVRNVTTTAQQDITIKEVEAEKH